MDEKIIGNNIAKLRKANNMSQQKLADKLNVSNKTISKWECCNGVPDIQSLSKIASIFNISVDEIIREEISLKKDVDEIKEDTKEKSKTNKKVLLSIIISISLVFAVTVTLLCYFLIPRKPKLFSYNLFEINEQTKVASGVINNNITTLSLNEEFDVPLTNTWNLYYDINGLQEIPSKTIELEEGDNTYYIVVENSKGLKSTYNLIIRRKPMYTISFDSVGGTYVPDQSVMEGEIASVITPTKTGYDFNHWDYDFSTPITSNINATAIWTAKTLYIKYNSNNDKNEEYNQTVTYDQNVTIKTFSLFSNSGYYLASWNTERDGTGTSYSTGEYFENYNNLTDITLFAQWKIIETDVSDFEFSTSNDGTYYIIDKYSGSSEYIIIPDTYKDKPVKQIANDVFRDKSFIKSCIIPETINYIGEYTFSGCSNLKNLVIEGNVELGIKAFSGCSSLDKLPLEKITNADGFIFENCTGITAVTIPSSWTKIYYSCFRGCTSLKSVDIPSTIQEIGSDAFFECTALENVKIPSSVKKIYDQAFIKCYNLKNLEIENGVETIDMNAFLSCTSLESVVIPNSVKTIGSAAFNGCTSLKTLTLGTGITNYINYRAFDGCENLEIVKILGNIPIIELATFFNCPKLNCIIVESSFTNFDDLYDVTESHTIIYSKMTSKPSDFDSSWNSRIYFYSETQPTSSGNYWHYIGETPTKWN